MKLMTTIICLGLSNICFAEENLYKKIEDLYQFGSQIDLSQYDGTTMSGRCFLYSAPRDPKASFIAIQKKVSDVGPIADPIETFYVESWFHPSRPANTYDHMTLDQIEQLEHFRQWSEIKPKDMTTHWTEFKDGAAFYRKNQGYIVKKITDRMNVGQVMCYYFLVN